MSERILVIRFSSLGDVVLTEPVFRALKQKYLQAQIALATKKEYAGVFEGYSNIDRLFNLDGGLEKLAREIRAFKPDLIVDLHRNFRSRRLAGQFPEARKLTYAKARWERFLKVLTKTRRPVAHTMERYLKTVEAVGSVAFPQLNASTSKDHRRWVGPAGFTVGFGLGAKWEAKLWPVGHFSQLAELLSKSFPVGRFILFGSEEEYELGNEFKKKFSGSSPAVMVFGQPLERAKNCLSKLDLLVSNDSGLMHLGAACGVPTLGLFGPTHPVLGFAPLGEKSKALSLDLYCSPCSLHGKLPCFRSRRFCLEDLTPEKVFEEARAVLKSVKPKPVLEPVPAVFMDRDGVVIRERNFDYTPDNIEILPGAPGAIRRLKEAGFKIVIVSNQSGVGRGFLTVEGVEAVHSAVQEKLKKEGAEIDRFYFCPHWSDGAVEKFRKECVCRKPETGMPELADLELGIDFSRSFVVGDRVTDLELGWKKGMRSILVLTGQGKRAQEELAEKRDDSAIVKGNVLEAAEHILGMKMEV
ncbi:MAG: HAD-IIIA family hydrolase [candidate division Zixibacteria bacterium]|nr:HAD-IIIA family hydrolase [candidate division Zixibacteria bacterium]